MIPDQYDTITAALATVLFVAAIVPWFWIKDRWSMRRRTRRLVFDNLDAAMANGYFEPGEALYGATADEIAYDMLVYAEDFEAGYEQKTLAPHVEEWLRKRQRVPAPRSSVDQSPSQ